jgi:hypothetical protein
MARPLEGVMAHPRMVEGGMVHLQMVEGDMAHPRMAEGGMVHPQMVEGDTGEAMDFQMAAVDMDRPDPIEDRPWVCRWVRP